MNAFRTFCTASAVSLALAGIQSADAGTFGNDYRVRVVNKSSETVYFLYATNRDAGIWDVDLLGNQVIPPGHSMVVDVDDYSGYCMYDLKAVSEYDSEWTNWNVNVCSLSTWTLWD